MTPEVRHRPAPLDPAAMRAARERWLTRAKPPRALGRIEDLGIHLAGVAGECPPPVPARPAVVVFAGDHGVVADGASAWPSEITMAMVETIAGGGAAVSCFADVIGAEVTVVDVGVQAAVSEGPRIIVRKVRPGAGNIAREPAMSIDEAGAAISVGFECAHHAVGRGADALIGGEMGIGNTTPSAALIAAVTGVGVESVVGPGAGVPGHGLDHKRELVRRALDRAPVDDDPVSLVAELGGLEIAALAGFYVGAAHLQVPYVVDGVIACAALCVAERLAPGTAARAVAGHRSSEPGAGVALGHLGLEPVLDLDLRLGEGTGACLAFPLLVAAATALARMDEIPRTQPGV